jgi:uncharacterized Zn-binding protein involved in type VI secretion
MTRLTALAHETVRRVLATGEYAVDATAANGHDTLFLSDIVGRAGRVFAFDIQPHVVERVSAVLAVRGVTNVVFACRSHAELVQTLPPGAVGRVGAVMFNLGYLPGGDRSVCTRPESTVAAIAAAVEVLRIGGVVSVVAYRGHEGGAAETEAVRGAFARLTSDRWTGLVTTEAGGTNSPIHIVARKQR